MELNVDLFPADGKAYFEGPYQLINDTGAPVNELHVVFQDGYSELVNIDIPSATLTLDEGEDYGYQIFALEQPMLPGEEMTVTFQSERIKKSFRTSGEDSRLVKNGIFLNNSEFAPSLGSTALYCYKIARHEGSMTCRLNCACRSLKTRRPESGITSAMSIGSCLILCTTSADQTPVAPGKVVE
ncbi:MAG: hypothetical protein CM15mP74_27700 [Halieaceae bacterium]|nr:MAG: hypothetical protein CM15mP74_27700 [Halieaceae bacterium]